METNKPSETDIDEILAEHVMGWRSIFSENPKKQFPFYLREIMLDLVFLNRGPGSPATPWRPTVNLKDAMEVADACGISIGEFVGDRPLAESAKLICMAALKKRPELCEKFALPIEPDCF